MGEVQVGLQARLMSQALRKLAGNLNRAKTVCLFTNQIREKIGVSLRQPGDPAGRPGAEVLLVAAPRPAPDRDPQGGHRGGRQPGPRARSSRTRSRRPSSRPSSTSTTARASRTRAACSSSASSNDIVTKSGSFFSYGETRLGQGRNNAKAFLRENPEMADEIEAKIYAALGVEQARGPKAPARRGRGRSRGAEAAEPRPPRPEARRRPAETEPPDAPSARARHRTRDAERAGDGAGGRARGAAPPRADVAELHAG